MAFFTPCWSAILVSFAVVGCAGSADPNPARIDAAAWHGASSSLDLTLTLTFSPTMLAALDHGIPLTLDFRIDPAHGPRQHQRVSLRFLPLLRRYQLDSGGNPAQSFASRLQLLSALDRLRLPVAAAKPVAGRVSFRLDTQALPAPLRLPALFDRDWHLQSAATAWAALP